MQEGSAEQSPVTEQPDSPVTIADMEKLIRQMRHFSKLRDELRVPSNRGDRRPTAGEIRRAKMKAEGLTSQDLTIQPGITDTIAQPSNPNPVPALLRPYVLERHLPEIDTADQVTGLWMYGFRAIEQWGKTFYPPKKPGEAFLRDIGLTSHYGDERRIQLDAIHRTANPLVVLLYDRRNRPTIDCRFLDEERALREGGGTGTLKVAGIGLVIHPPSRETRRRSTMDVTVYPYFSLDVQPIIPTKNLKIFHEDLKNIPSQSEKNGSSIPQSWHYKPSPEGESTLMTVLRRAIIG